MLHRLLLGPQRPHLNLGKELASLSLPEGPLAVVSAGWQEAEGDIDDLREEVKRPLLDLQLYQRAEQVFAADSVLRLALRERQDRLQELQRLYRLRLRQAMLAARQIRRAAASPDLLAGEERHAIAQLRALDRHHFRRTVAVHDEFASQIFESAALAEQQALVEEQLEACETVLITGGHVLVLLNRLQLFGMRKLLARRHLVAWSAGAMVLSDQVVLFHDQTPLGRRDPELLGAGMALLPGCVFLPDARKRLRQKDTVRMGLFKERFSPARCITLNSGASLHFSDNRVIRADSVGHLRGNGMVTDLRAS